MILKKGIKFCTITGLNRCKNIHHFQDIQISITNKYSYTEAYTHSAIIHNNSA